MVRAANAKDGGKDFVAKADNNADNLFIEDVSYVIYSAPPFLLVR